MTSKYAEYIGHHDLGIATKVGKVHVVLGHTEPSFTYTFRNFFHPWVGDLIARLNRESLPGLLAAQLDPAYVQHFFDAQYHPEQNNLVHVAYFPKEIEVEASKPYANYNWELFFHIPFTVATHLSKTRRFAEAQRWFHYIFDPTSNDTATPTPTRFWRFLGFRQGGGMRIQEIVRLLSQPRTSLTPADQALQDSLMNGYNEIRNKPFMPHAVARTRLLAYQFAVVMKYLDNLIAWGDLLFQQDTIESINEATQRYVLAASILGQRPQVVPPRGTVRAKTFAQLRNTLGPIGNALVELEGQFPFNLAAPGGGISGSGSGDSALFGIGRTLYFCVPRNDKLLGYWDLVGDRLFKIRHCMNIQGVVRQLALFDPPIDPGMMVKAAAAGIDIGSIVNGLTQPIGPVRSQTLIQKALELCGEVRSLGGALLAALEKGDAEHLALIRQRHENQIQGMTREVRFLQWQSALESMKSLNTTRKAALERLRSYQRLLGLPPDPNVPETLAVSGAQLTEENFDEQFANLVSQYDKQLTLQALPKLTLANESSPAQQSGASGAGRLFLNANENAELNTHLPTARDTRLAASVSDAVAAVLTFIPDFDVKLAFWGMGAGTRIFGGVKLHDAVKGAADILRMVSAWESDQASMAGRSAGHERRADDWILQYNLAAHELMGIGRQLLTAKIAEQIAHREYLTIQAQIENAAEVDQFLHDKFTNEDLHLWMQGELSRLYYEYYRFAFDTARKAERAMRQELMRPEVNDQDFIKFNYWDGGRKGLLAGEALHLDVKRMELAYLENNRRELELTRHVSLRQLDPMALLTLRTTGTCTVTVPEWLYDRDCPGHYMRRIKSVALSIPSVVGPYTGVHCTLSLLRSTVRTSPIPRDNEYTRQGAEDDRFVDYAGAIQSIVTSVAMNDSGLFEANLRDERFLPFEGAGAESTWKLELPRNYRVFDYGTISDVVLHIRYTARQGVDATKVQTALDDLFAEEDRAGLALLYSLRHDFPTEWAAFANGAGDLSLTIPRHYFPYFAQDRIITVTRMEIYSGADLARHHAVGNIGDATNGLVADPREFTVTAAPDPAGPGQVLTRSAKSIFLIVRYTLG